VNWFKSFWESLNKPMSRDEGNIEKVNNFSPQSQQLLGLARQEAQRFNHNFVGTEHLLLGMIRLGQGTAVSVLEKLGLNLERVRTEVEMQVGTGPEEECRGSILYTPRVKKVLALAAKEANALKSKYIGTEHILLGLLIEGDGVAARVLDHFDVNVAKTRQQISLELDPNCSPHILLDPVKTDQGSELVNIRKRYDVYCRDGWHEIVYRNVRFKPPKTLFKQRERDIFCEFLELEQADGTSVFVSRSDIRKFCEPGVTPAVERVRNR
jgi:Clp amino terminal domain, pathogenicity island component